MDYLPCETFMSLELKLPGFCHAVRIREEVGRENTVHSDDLKTARQNKALRSAGLGARCTKTNLAINVLMCLPQVTQAGPRLPGGIPRMFHGG